jgi:type IX secretion system PorP/SprF family membrane protein
LKAYFPNILCSILLCFLLGIQQVFAQLVPVYSQYLVNHSILNPAYVGIDNCLNVNALYRQQWVNYAGSPSTRTFSAHSPFRNRSLAAGINFVNDVIGVTSNTQVEGQFAYRLRVREKSKLSFGLGLGLFNNKNNFSDLNTNDNNDEVFLNNLNTTLPTFSFGTYFENDRYFVGLSSLNLTRNFSNTEAFVQQQPFYLTSGYHFKFGENVIVTPSVLVKKLINSPVNTDLNLFFDYVKMFRLGISYRQDEACYGIIQLKLNHQFQIGYSYDYFTSSIRKYHNGAHEVSIKYVFQYQTNTVNVKSLE